jgi:hypothetical protein
MPGTPIRTTYQNATETTLTSSGVNGNWTLQPSTAEPKVEGAAHWHFESTEAGHNGTVTVKTPSGNKVTDDLITCSHVYVQAGQTTISGGRKPDPTVPLPA